MTVSGGMNLKVIKGYFCILLKLHSLQQNYTYPHLLQCGFLAPPTRRGEVYVTKFEHGHATWVVA